MKEELVMKTKRRSECVTTGYLNYAKTLQRRRKGQAVDLLFSGFRQRERLFDTASRARQGKVQIEETGVVPVVVDQTRSIYTHEVLVPTTY